MNKIRIFALSAACVLTLSSMSLIVRGDEKTYDPENDPLISLSYLNGVFAPKYDAKIKETSDKLTETEKKLTETADKLSAAESTVAASKIKLAELESKLVNLETKVAELTHEAENSVPSGYEVICLYDGQKLLAKSPLEIILRSGTAITVSITSNGVNDLSDGTELMNADAVPLYHQLLVPRGDDGRGIQITSAEAYIMVRGEYEIIE